MDGLWIFAGVYFAAGLFAFWKRAQLAGLFEPGADSSDQRALVLALFVLCIAFGPVAAMSTLIAMFELSRSDQKRSDPHT